MEELASHIKARVKAFLLARQLDCDLWTLLPGHGRCRRAPRSASGRLHADPPRADELGLPSSDGDDENSNPIQT